MTTTIKEVKALLLLEYIMSKLVMATTGEKNA